jgi:uncharacterized paraquat-inducible protein A
MTKKDVKISIISAVIGLIITGIWDIIKSKPILSTLRTIINWIWEYVLNFNVKIWQFSIILIAYYLLKKVLKKPLVLPSFLNYTSDKINNTKWCWEWNYNSFDEKWNIKNIKPICPDCDTKMINYQEGFMYGFEAKCPRCDKHLYRLKSPQEIEAIIIDNIDKSKN